jgi:hypothetical protein
MADKITLKSASEYDGRYLGLTCIQTKNGGVENTSTIEWTLYSIGGSVDYSTGPTKVVINGKTVYSQDRVSWESQKFPAVKGTKQGTLVVNHNNDGKKTINVSLSTAIYYRDVKEATATWTLDTIERYPTVKNSVVSTTETTATVNWESDLDVDAIYYSTDGGTTWSSAITASGKKGSYTISGLSANTDFKIATKARSKDSGLTGNSTAVSATTYNYPYCSETSSFMIGQTVLFRFYNPLKRTFNFSFLVDGATLFTFTVEGGNTYEWQQSLGQQGALYNAIPNDYMKEYAIRAVYNGVTRLTSSLKVFMVDPTKCAPTFTDFSYRDTDSITGTVNPNNQILIKGLSSLFVWIPEANKAVAKYGATIDYYQVSIDTLSVKIPRENAVYGAIIGNINSHGTKRLTVYAYDSRGLGTPVAKDVTVLDYEYPVINASAKRLNNFEAQTTLTVSGTYTPLVVNGTALNAMELATYSCRETGGAFVQSGMLTMNFADGKYTCSDVIMSLDNKKSYIFTITVNDAFGYPVELTVPVGKGKAIFFISTNQEACFINDQKIIMYDVIDTWGGW